MKKITFFFLIIASVFIFTSCSKMQRSNTDIRRPKLIIGIVVDQMAFDYYQRYESKFSKNGLKRLFSEGFNCSNSYFDHFPTFTGPGHSTIYTGSDPGFHGIVANDWFERSRNKKIYCTEDPDENTVGSFSTDGKMSPRNLLSTTITDRLKLTSNFKSKVVGIALKDRGAILPAGHFADAAYWYDIPSNHWVTSTYYMKSLPVWVEDFNRKDMTNEYLDKDWNTLLPIEKYTESTADDNNFEKTYKGENKPVFPHKLSELKYLNNNLIQYSPYGNDITKDFAIEVINNMALGKGEATDFLCISFSSTDYVSHMFVPYSVETEDTYMRLDKNIEELLESVDKSVGINNTLFFLTADHGNSPNPLFLKEHKLDAGAFYYRSGEDSCNNYLQKTFGIVSGIKAFINQQIYLDYEKINSSKFSISTISDSLGAYLTRTFKEIQNVYPAYRLTEQSINDPIAKSFLLGYNSNRSGDIFINYKPFYIEETMKGTEHGSAYIYDSHVPLVWFGWQIVKGETCIYYPVKSIVPTIAQILNIDSPEISFKMPIIELLNLLKK